MCTRQDATFIYTIDKKAPEVFFNMENFDDAVLKKVKEMAAIEGGAWVNRMLEDADKNSTKYGITFKKAFDNLYFAWCESRQVKAEEERKLSEFQKFLKYLGL